MSEEQRKIVAEMQIAWFYKYSLRQLEKRLKL